MIYINYIAEVGYAQGCHVISPTVTCWPKRRGNNRFVRGYDEEPQLTTRVGGQQVYGLWPVEQYILRQQLCLLNLPMEEVIIDEPVKRGLKKKTRLKRHYVSGKRNNKVIRHHDYVETKQL